MRIDPTQFRAVGSILLPKTILSKRLPTQLDYPLLRLTCTIGPPPPGQADNRKNWTWGGYARQIDARGTEIKQERLSLLRSRFFRTDPSLLPYLIEATRPNWAWPITLKIEGYFGPWEDSDHQYEIEVDAAFT
jgi:hypothetical protein